MRSARPFHWRWSRLPAEGVGHQNVLVIPGDVAARQRFAMRIQAGATESWTPVGKSGCLLSCRPKKLPLLNAALGGMCLSSLARAPHCSPLLPATPVGRKPSPLTHACTHAIRLFLSEVRWLKSAADESIRSR